MEIFPPIAAANTIGIKNLVWLKPPFLQIPITTGIITAAVPVLDKKPDIIPVSIIIAIIRIVSFLANLLTTLPTSTATPVSKKAAPIINIAINKITLESTKPLKASVAVNTPERCNPTATIIAVIDNGIFSNANITIANTRNPNVIATL